MTEPTGARRLDGSKREAGREAGSNMAPPILKGEAWGLCRGRVQDGRAASRHNRHGVTSESVPHQAVPAQMVRMNGGGC